MLDEALVPKYKINSHARVKEYVFQICKIWDNNERGPLTGPMILDFMRESGMLIERLQAVSENTIRKYMRAAGYNIISHQEIAKIKALKDKELTRKLKADIENEEYNKVLEIEEELKKKVKFGDSVDFDKLAQDQILFLVASTIFNLRKAIKSKVQSNVKSAIDAFEKVYKQVTSSRVINDKASINVNLTPGTSALFSNYLKIDDKTSNRIKKFIED